MSQRQDSLFEDNRLLISCDHAAVALKKHLIAMLSSSGLAVTALGPDDEAQSVDYPLIATEFATLFRQENFQKGILLCGSGVGVTVGVNRFPWIRAVHAHDVLLAEMSRRHNDANVLCMGARYLTETVACAILDVWLKTPFDGERHQKRVNQLTTDCCPAESWPR